MKDILNVAGVEGLIVERELLILDQVKRQGLSYGMSKIDDITNGREDAELLSMDNAPSDLFRSQYPNF
jgi:hypothetical protein